jgi:hypothetical protein
LLQSVLLTLDEHTLAGEDEEALLRGLGMVEAARTAGPEHRKGNPDLREALLVEIGALAQDTPVRLEDTGGPEDLVAYPGCLAHVDYKPAGADRSEAGANILETSLLDHLHLTCSLRGILANGG